MKRLFINRLPAILVFFAALFCGAIDTFREWSLKRKLKADYEGPLS